MLPKTLTLSQQFATERQRKRFEPVRTKTDVFSVRKWASAFHAGLRIDEFVGKVWFTKLYTHPECFTVSYLTLL